MELDLYNTEHEKITLTKEQESCLNYAGDKTLLVKGIAGGGKSVVLQGFTKKLLAQSPKDIKNNIAIFTFNNTLNACTRELVGETNEESVLVSTLDSYISKVYSAIGPKLKMYYKQGYQEEIIKKALEKHKETCGPHRFQNLEPEFWIEEIRWMKEMNVSAEDRQYYLELPRKGRGGKVRMSASDRIAAFQIYIKYEEERKSKDAGDWIDQALYLAHNAEKIPEQYKFRHVLLDEAQDLPLVKMKAAMAFAGKDMVIAMDMNQRIYQKYWTPGMLGIGTTTKKLTKSMRTTKQIDDLAESLRRHNDEFLSEDDRSIRVIPEKEGSLPRLVHLTDPEQEKKYVTEWIRKCIKKNPKCSIGVIAAKNTQIKKYASWMTDAGIMHEDIKKDSTFSLRTLGVKIVNAYNAKGLEFTYVIIPELTEGNFPYYFNPKDKDKEEIQNFYINGRNLLYVAMTRAKRSLLLTYSGNKGSRFIGELDKDAYEAVGEITYVKPDDGITGSGAGRQKKLDYESLILPPVVQKEKLTTEGKDLKTYLQDKGLEIVDKRSSGGVLWIVGEKTALQPIIREIGELYGAYGNFSEGNRATKRRPGWFTSCRK